MLGSTQKVDLVERQGYSEDNMMHDLKLRFSCPNQWSIQGSSTPSKIGGIIDQYMEVDPETCIPLNMPAEGTQEELEFNQAKENMMTNQIWERVKFTLFSMMVSASLFAAYNVTTFYTGVVLVVSTMLRPNLIFSTFMGFLYETTHPDAIIKLIEACYMKRHEEDLIGEEETYRMLQEIMRQPELFKSLTGSSLKGSCDPMLDNMAADELRKLEHLDMLERKGFEVTQLKTRLLENQKKKLNDIHNV